MPDAPIPRDEPSIVTGDAYVDDRSVKVVAEVEDRLIRIFPATNPLLVLTSKANKSREAEYYKFEFLERDLQPRNVTVAAAGAAGATTITVATDDYKKLVQRMVLLNTRTREHYLLTVTPTNDSVVVVRAIGGGGADVAIGDTLEVQAPISAEGDKIGTIQSVVENKLFNYTEIVRTPTGWTRRTANTKYYGGREPVNLKFDAAQQHKISLEKRGFFGKRHTRTATNGLQTFTGGIEYFVKSHVWDLAGASLTERGLVEWSEDVLALGDNGYINGNGVKWLFCGNSLITEIEFFARDRLRYEPLSSKIGMKAAQFTSTHGTFNIMRHPQFTGDHSGWGFVVDLAHVKKVNYRGGEMKLYASRQDPSFDGEEIEYLSDTGWQIENQAAFGIIKNHKQRV